jgi:arylsulfatase A-like enzyme
MINSKLPIFRILSFLLFAAVLQAAPKRPNVVFFLADDLGVNDIGANNRATFYETPHIDRLAREGVRFTAGYAAHTVCSPTRYSLQTGKYPARGPHTNWFTARDKRRFFGAEYTNVMALAETTLGEAFHEAGYRTVFIGKWHLGPDADYWPEKHGYDVNIGGCNKGNPGKDGYFSPYNNPRLPDGPKGEYLTDRLAAEAVKQISENKDRPFLLYFAFYQVHTPLLAPEPLIQKYRDKAARLGLPTEGAVYTNTTEIAGDGRPVHVRRIQSHPIYAAMVESMDTAVGRVIDALKTAGVYDNTIICFTSDNGGEANNPTSNLPIRGGKQWIYEGGHRVPFIIRAPGLAPAVTETPAISPDFYPTLLDLAGLPLRPAQHLDGVSLKPLLEGKAPPPRESLYWHYPHYGVFPGGALRRGDWKFIRRYEDGRTELYNLRADPYETTDLSTRDPDKARELAAEHDRWLQTVDARFLREKDGSGQPWRPAYKTATTPPDGLKPLPRD